MDIRAFFARLINAIDAYLEGWRQDYLHRNDDPMPDVPPEQPVVPPVPSEVAPKPVPPPLLWDKEHAWHSCRVIMDEYGLSWKEKDILCACIMQESRFDAKAIGPKNSNGTQDFGLAQFNNGKNKQGVPYWIGPGAAFASVDEVLNNPEKNVRVMVEEYKRGNLRRWASYSTGAYKKWL